MAGSANDIIISPVNVFWQIEFNHQFDFSAFSDPDGTYFLLNSAKDATEYYVWFDLDGGSVDPAPAGKTGIEINVTTGDSASVIAAAVQAAIDALGDFDATVSGAVVDVKGAAVGEVTDSADVDSGVVVTICRRGKDVEIGLLEGDVAPTNDIQTFDVTSHQFGITPLSSLVLGAISEVVMTAQETTRSKMEEYFKIYGGKFTPASGTEVIGIGTASIGKNMLVEAARLRLVPVNDFGNELSWEYNKMLAVPVPSTLTFSGENPRTLELNWKVYPDLSIDNRGNIVTIGDATQF